MLIGENCRRSQYGDLFAIHHRLERRTHRNLGLAVSDIADYQPIHRDRRFHVALNVVNRSGLIDGQIERKRVFEFVLPGSVGRECVARDQFSFGV